MRPRYFHELWDEATAPPLSAEPVDEALQAIVGKAAAGSQARRILDVGAGVGASRDVISKSPAQRIEVDISPVPLAREAAAHDVLRVVADGAALPFPDDQFDAVTVIDVLSI